jgi:hypothetical protein
VKGLIGQKLEIKRSQLPSLNHIKSSTYLSNQRMNKYSMLKTVLLAIESHTKIYTLKLKERRKEQLLRYKPNSVRFMTNQTINTYQHFGTLISEFASQQNMVTVKRNIISFYYMFCSRLLNYNG